MRSKSKVHNGTLLLSELDTVSDVFDQYVDHLAQQASEN